MTIIKLAVTGFAILGLAGCATTDIHATVAPATTAAAVVPLTLATYAQIQEGMTLAQVQAILGTSDIATATLPDSSAGNEDGVYMWGSPSGAAAGRGMVLGTFQGGVLIARSEIGLT